MEYYEDDDKGERVVEVGCYLRCLCLGAFCVTSGIDINIDPRPIRL